MRQAWSVQSTLPQIGCPIRDHKLATLQTNRTRQHEKGLTKKLNMPTDQYKARLSRLAYRSSAKPRFFCGVLVYKYLI